jgi:hypothetical protein
MATGTRKRACVIALVTGVIAAAAPPDSASGVALNRGLASKTCGGDYVLANLSWGHKCLGAGEFCKVGNVEYHAYGFACPATGHLTAYQESSSGTASTPTATPTPPASVPTAAVAIGQTVLVAHRTRTSGCRRGPEPDRRCSPGAYYSGLKTAVICSGSFSSSTIRDVPQSEKFQVESEYGMTPTYYGYSIEIDHIVPLELGGSNNIANLFPEPGSGNTNYHVKDELENKLHDLVCAGAMSLSAARAGIATNWETLYRRVYGVAPTNVS